MLSKLHAIPGDITSPGLGLSAEHAQLLQQEISVVFHSAATVKFDEKLRLSVEMNVLGMQRLVELAKKMTNLEVKLIIYIQLLINDRSSTFYQSNFLTIFVSGEDMI